MREGSPPFNAALIGYLEASSRRRRRAELARAAQPVSQLGRGLDPGATRRDDRSTPVGSDARRPDWIERSRLNIAAGLLDHAGEPGVAQAIGSYLENGDQAIENLGTLRAQLGDALTESVV